MTTTNDPAAVAALIERLRAPAYWFSGSDQGHEGENEAPIEAADALEAAAAREAALNARIASLERLEWAVRKVVETFREDEAQGYRSRERRYAIDMLGRYLPPLPETSDKGGEDV